MDEVERPTDAFATYRFSLGALLFCITRWLTVLTELGDDAGVVRAEQAKAKLDQARDLEYDWEKQKQGNTLTRQGGPRLDNKIDDTLGSLADAVGSYASIETGSEPTRLARELSEDLFPNGVFHITSKTFDDQHATVLRLTKRMREEYAKHIRELRLEPIVDRLEELNAEFGEILDSASDNVHYDEVESARVEAEDAFHRLLGHLIAEHGGDHETFKRVMTPLNEQARRTRRQLKRRGTIPEVDPETGEPLDPDDEADNRSDDAGEQNDGGQEDGRSEDEPRSEGDSENDGDSSSDESETDDGEPS